MDHTALLFAQLTDIFRIGLVAGLIYTMERTKLQTGIVTPMLAGIVFIAVIIASTVPLAGVEQWRAIASGLIANAILIAALMAIWSTVKRTIAK